MPPLSSGDKLWEAGSALVAVMHRLYYKENGEWIEQTTTRKVEESEVPATSGTA